MVEISFEEGHLHLGYFYWIDEYVTNTTARRVCL